MKSQQRAYLSTVLNPAGIGLKDNETQPFVYLDKWLFNIFLYRTGGNT